MSERPARFQVGILGAGVVGCSIAYHLARRKIATVVLDREGAGGGASAADSGAVWTHPFTRPACVRLALRSAARYPRLQEAIGPIEYLRTGGLAPAFTEENAQAGIALAERQQAAGLDVRWLPRDEVLRREPALSPAVLGATYSPHDGSVNPFLLVRRLVSAARRYGAEFLLHWGHVAIDPGPRGFLLRSTRGEVEVRRLVVAAGPWTHEAGRGLGVPIPLRQVHEPVLVSEALPPLLRHTIVGARQQITGEILLGCSPDGPWTDPGISPDAIRRVVRDGVRLVPALRSARMIRAFSGIQAVPMDESPILGGVAEVEGLYIAATHRGIALAPLIGDAMAALIDTGRVPDDIRDYGLERFHPGTLRGAESRQDSPKNL